MSDHKKTNSNDAITKTNFTRKNVEVRSLIDQIDKQEITVGSTMQSFLSQIARENKQEFTPLPYMRAQRNFTWNKDMCSRFIFAVMMLNDPITDIRLYDTSFDGKYLKCLDGQQRLTTLWMFVKNKFQLDMSHADYNKFVLFGEEHSVDELNGKTFSELPQTWQDRLLNYPQEVVIFRNCSEEQANGIYKRMSTISKPLKPIEVRKADMSDDVYNLIYQQMLNQAWAFHTMTIKAAAANFGLDISTQFLALLYHNVPIALTRDSIDKAIHDMSNFGINVEFKNKVKNTIEYLNQATNIMITTKKTLDENTQNRKGKRITHYDRYKFPIFKNKTYIVMFIWAGYVATQKQIDVNKFAIWTMKFFESPSVLFNKGMATEKGVKPGDLENVQKRIKAIDIEMNKLNGAQESSEKKQEANNVNSHESVTNTDSKA